MCVIVRSCSLLGRSPGIIQAHKYPHFRFEWAARNLRPVATSAESCSREGFPVTQGPISSTEKVSEAPQSFSSVPPGSYMLSGKTSCPLAEKSADEIQAFASRIRQDRQLAIQLALMPSVLETIRSASNVSASNPTVGRSIEDSPTSTADVAKDRLNSDGPLPTARQQGLYFVNNFLPFVGFGFLDNAIMILVGDLVDARLGAVLGISTLAAAALGNTVSDIVGIWGSGFIETANAALGVPKSGLTSEQRASLRMRILKNCACASGIAIGCLLGMAPLMWPDEWRLWDSRSEHGDRESKIELTSASRQISLERPAFIDTLHILPYGGTSENQVTMPSWQISVEESAFVKSLDDSILESPGAIDSLHVFPHKLSQFRG